MIGPGMTMPADGGIVLALCTVTALITLSVLARDLLVLALGAWGALQFLPIAISEWFPGEVAAAVALLIAGGVLVSAAIWIARRRGVSPPAGAARRDYAVLPVRVARIASAVVALTVTAVVVVLGTT